MVTHAPLTVYNSPNTAKRQVFLTGTTFFLIIIFMRLLLRHKLNNIIAM